MNKPSFTIQLSQAMQKQHSLLCIGLDPDIKQLPKEVLREEFPLFIFNRAIIDKTHDLVCAYKPQMAYYAASGRENELEMTIHYIQNHYPHIPVILDAKRGDIGSTAQQYAIEAFVRYAVEAVTVNPYLGFDTLEPFLNYHDKGVIILCHTSNPGAADIQELMIGDKRLYEKIAMMAVSHNQHGNIALVMGGTYPQALRDIRTIVGDMPLLVPGIGAQGASIQEVVTHGKTANGEGLIISASRSVIYASAHADFAHAARIAALQLRDEINKYR